MRVCGKSSLYCQSLGGHRTHFVLVLHIVANAQSCHMLADEPGGTRAY